MFCLSPCVFQGRLQAPFPVPRISLPAARKGLGTPLEIRELGGSPQSLQAEGREGSHLCGKKGEAMIIRFVMIAVCSLLAGWPNLSWADDGPCGGLPAGSLSRMECERNARARPKPVDREPQRPRSSTPSGTASQLFYGNPSSNPGEALCGKWLGGTAEEAERFLACRKAAEEGRHPVQIEERQAQEERRRRMEEQQRLDAERRQMEAERRQRMELDERRTRAMEEAARAQREQAEISGRPLVCGWVYDFNVGRVWQCERR